MRVGSAGHIGLYLAAIVFALSAYLVNGQPLFYYDTASYLDQGARLIGSPPPREVTKAAAPADPAQQTGAAAASQPTAAEDTTVVGSRAVAYSLALALVMSLAGPLGMIAANLAAIWFAVWILARRLSATEGASLTPGVLTAVGLLAGCLGSLPFYVAFLMPDILAPALILIIAVLCVHAGRMTWAERAAAVLLALFAVVAHPSHLLLAFATAPFVFFASPVVSGRRLSLALALIGILVGAGLAERFVFGMAVERYLHKRVVYLPFVTARLVDDGPGLQYLADRCPDPSYPTCALFAALSTSDSSARLDAPNILFARSPDRGSYQRLPDNEKTAVSAHQIAFLKDVVRTHPFAIAVAFVRNTLTQLAFISVEMTVPTPEMVSAADILTDRLPRSLRDGRLISTDPKWAPALTAAHGFIYLASLAVLASLAIRRRLSRDDLAMITIVLGGIVANAVVCGAVSEPAHRYGARVMFLLPLMAAMFWLSASVRNSATGRMTVIR